MSGDDPRSRLSPGFVFTRAAAGTAGGLVVLLAGYSLYLVRGIIVLVLVGLFASRLLVITFTGTRISAMTLFPPDVLRQFGLPPNPAAMSETGHASDVTSSRVVGLTSLFVGVGNAVGNGRPDHAIQHGHSQQ